MLISIYILHRIEQLRNKIEHQKVEMIEETRRIRQMENFHDRCNRDEIKALKKRIQLLEQLHSVNTDKDKK